MGVLLRILLFLLKAAGIILLAIIGLVLLLLCILLFVPIRYDVQVRYKDKPDIRAKVTFLLKIVRVRFEMLGKEQKLMAKILCFNLLSDKKKGKKAKTPKKEKSQEPSDGSEAQELVFEAQEDAAGEPKKQETEIKDGETGPGKKAEKGKSGRKDKSGKTQAGKRTEGGGIADIIQKAVSMIKENKAVLSFLWKQIKALFKHILPGTHVINIKLGLDDPATLGEIIGAVALVRAATNLVVNITPDFENKVVEADCRFKGRIRLGKLLFIALRVYFNKDVKNILKMMKN